MKIITFELWKELHKNIAIRNFDSFCEIYPTLVADRKLLLCYLPTKA